LTPEILSPEQFLFLALRLPVIDVRSPGEFQQGHIPGAHNIPLFDNDERARVGTTYVKIGKEPAIELGKIIAGEKTDYYLDAVRELVPGYFYSKAAIKLTGDLSGASFHQDGLFF
jgi:tRNA 2-selenouridine synthase